MKKTLLLPFIFAAGASQSIWSASLEQRTAQFRENFGMVTGIMDVLKSKKPSDDALRTALEMTKFIDNQAVRNAMVTLINEELWFVNPTIDASNAYRKQRSLDTWKEVFSGHLSAVQAILSHFQHASIKYLENAKEIAQTIKSKGSPDRWKPVREGMLYLIDEGMNILSMKEQRAHEEESQAKRRNVLMPIANDPAWLREWKQYLSQQPDDWTIFIGSRKHPSHGTPYDKSDLLNLTDGEIKKINIKADIKTKQELAKAVAQGLELTMD